MVHATARLVLILCAMFILDLDAKIYDYIIVGAGSAGATLANRLSEISTVNILLIEAGVKPSKTSDIPLLAFKLQLTSEDWNYTTEPQPVGCRGSIDNKCYYGRGRVLGGSSTTNFMMYVRGNKNDFNNWAKDGATGWSYKDVLPYFIKAEDVMITKDIDQTYHGHNGPLTVDFPPYKTKLKNAYIESAEALGYKMKDYNAQNQYVFSESQATIRSGFRCSTEKAYLRPAYNRTNLRIITASLVTKVKISNGVAVGVHYTMTDGTSHYVKASKEVILSAGSINTPQILMLSGIGPKKHLNELGIRCIADLPVGQNLQDHCLTGGVYYTVNTTNTIITSEVLRDNNTPGFGPLTSIGGVEATGFFKSAQHPSENTPAYQLIYMSIMLSYQLTKKEVNDFLERNMNRHIFSILPVLLHGKARGTVTLKSTNPKDPPAIYMPYLSNDYDLEVMLEAIKKAKEIALQEPLRRFGAEFLNDSLPGCEQFDRESDEYSKCLALTLTQTIFHPVGSCKMGDPRNADTVVDPELRVKGINNLRVVDGSIMPTITSGNTNAAVIMIGEKAADIIKLAYTKNS